MIHRTFIVKKLTLATALTLSALVIAPAQAATSTGAFDVNITLTSKCEINSANAASGAVIADLGLLYTSFQTGPSTGSTSFNVRCTNTLPFGLALDTAAVTDGTTGLAYTLALSTNATAIATAVVELTGQSGTGANVQYFVHGNIASGQAGTNTVGTANKQRTLTITY